MGAWTRSRVRLGRCTVEPAGRWEAREAAPEAMAGWAAVDAEDAEGKLYGVSQLEDYYGRPVLLFNADWKMNKVVADSGERLQLRSASPRQWHGNLTS